MFWIFVRIASLSFHAQHNNPLLQKKYEKIRKEYPRITRKIFLFNKSSDIISSNHIIATLDQPDMIPTILS